MDIDADVDVDGDMQRNVYSRRKLWGMMRDNADREECSGRDRQGVR